MIDTQEYSIAYFQVLEVLKGLSRSEYKKIPQERIEFYEKNKEKNYEFKLDKTRNFNEQISDTAQAIIANLFIKYIATAKDKQQIYEREKQKYIEEELEKRKNLNIRPLFQNKEKDTREIPKEESLVIIQKKGFFEKLFNKIKNFLKFRKKDER